MKTHSPFHRLVAFLATTAGLALAVGIAPGCCDSGGGEEPSGGSTGRVAVLLTDQTIDGFTAG